MDALYLLFHRFNSTIGSGAIMTVIGAYMLQNNEEYAINEKTKFLI